jgi:predicted porin
MQYVFWNVQHTDKNADEYRFNLGVQHQVYKDVVVSTDYTLRDLNDMGQSIAHEASVSVNYALSKNLDAGAFIHYSSFDPVKNGFTADSANKQGIGAYMSYRF